MKFLDVSSTEIFPSSKLAADKNVESINIKINPATINGKCILTNDCNDARVLLFFRIGMDLLIIRKK